MDLLSAGLKELGLEAPIKLEEELRLYVSMIESCNPALKLVGASGNELITKHILDSLAPIAIIKSLLSDTKSPSKKFSLIDIGSGAGLPGIPLAIALPELSVSLLDRMTRRINFLKNVKNELGLNNVTIIEGQAEHAKGSYNIITFRAFKPFEYKLFKKVFSLCRSDGYVLAYKGKKEKATAELEAIRSLYSSAKIEELSVPFLADERCLLVMQPKIKG